MTINYNKITVTLPDSLGEILLGQYMEYSRLIDELRQDDFHSIESQMKLFRINEILCGLPDGGLDILEIDEMNDLSSKVNDMIINGPTFVPAQTFTIDGITYGGRVGLKSMNKLSTGEYTSMAMLRDQYQQTDMYKFMELALAILIRPVHEVLDTETNEIRWEQEPFSAKDIENLQYRSKLFMEKALAKDLMPVLTFFLSGMNNLTETTPTSLEVEPQ